MPRTLSPTAAASALAEQTAEVWLVCLTISGAGLDTMRVVNNNEAVVRAAGTFQPYPFEVELPEDSREWNGSVPLRIDNIDREVARLVRHYSGQPEVRLEVVLASQPDTVEMGPFDFTVLSAEIDVMALVLQLGYAEGFLNQSVPAQTFTPTNSPGLFV